MAGPVLMLALVLPKVQPLEWVGVWIAMALFGVLVASSLLGFRRPGLRARPGYVLTSTILASSAAGAAIVASQDPGTTVPMALLVAMAFQVVARGRREFVVFSWTYGIAVFVVARAMLGLPASDIVTHTVLFAGLTAVVLATLRFLVESTRSAQRDAEALADLARRTSAARSVEEAVASSADLITALTGAERVRAVAGPVGEEPRDGIEQVPLGSGARGPVTLVIDGFGGTPSSMRSAICSPRSANVSAPSASWCVTHTPIRSPGWPTAGVSTTASRRWERGSTGPWS